MHNSQDAWRISFSPAVIHWALAIGHWSLLIRNHTLSQKPLLSPTMKRFEFKLQAVLTLRQRAEQAELEKYSRSLQHRQGAAERLAETEMELCEARRQWLNALADG